MSKTRNHIPKRTCLGCYQIKEKYSLIRFIIQSEARNIIIDPSPTEHGRGNYICPDVDCLRRLKRSKKYKKVTADISQTDNNRFFQELEAMIQSDKIFSLAGLARRAGKVAVGAQAVEAVIKKKKAKLVILAEDTAPNTRDHFLFLMATFERKFIVYGKKDDWGKLFAKESVAVLAILHDQFAKAIKVEFNMMNDKRKQ